MYKQLTAKQKKGCLNKTRPTGLILKEINGICNFAPVFVVIRPK
jgi:hypothetical protein